MNIKIYQYFLIILIIFSTTAVFGQSNKLKNDSENDEIELSNDTDLIQARKLMDSQDYRGAMPLLMKVLKRGGNPQGVVVEVYRRIGWCEAALRKNKNSIEAFKIMMSLRPDYRLPSLVSPLIKNSYEKALQYWNTYQRPVIIYDTPEQPAKEGRVSIRGKIVGNDLNLIKSFDLYKKNNDEPDFTPYIASKSDGYSKQWDFDMIKGDKIEYYFLAKDQYGNELLLSGTRDNPFILELKRTEEKTNKNIILYSDKINETKQSETSWYQKWWVWTSIGAGVVAITGGVLLGIMLGGQSDASCPGDVDTCIEIEP